MSQAFGLDLETAGREGAFAVRFPASGFRSCRGVVENEAGLPILWKRLTWRAGRRYWRFFGRGRKVPRAAEGRRQAVIDAKLLQILVCPACKARVRLEGERLVCEKPGCGLRYPIRDDIPVMLVEEAEKPGQAPKK